MMYNEVKKRGMKLDKLKQGAEVSKLTIGVAPEEELLPSSLPRDYAKTVVPPWLSIFQ